MRQTNLGIPIREKNGRITDVLLAMKKRGFGEGWWNGVGGKLNPNENMEDSLRREAKEELGIDIVAFDKVAEIEFKFPNNPEWDQIMVVYLIRNWTGEPQESEEMKPQWFDFKDIPYDKMWPADPHFLPQVFAGEKVKAEFVMGEAHKLLSYKVETVDAL